MTAAAATARIRLGRAGRRVFWAVMLLVHAPAWLTACGVLGGNPQSLRAIFLTSFVALFILKLLDVSWLRLKPGRRSWISVGIGVALLHSGAIHRQLAPIPDDGGAWPAALITTGLFFVAAAAETRNPERVGSRRPGARSKHDFALRLQSILAAVLAPRFLLLLRSVSITRAPPAW